MNKLIISLLSIVAATMAAAQSYTGTWEIFSSYGTPSKVIETPEYVYALAGTSLNYYDKTTGEVGVMNSSNRLNANKVTNMWYDPEEKYLFVVYDDYGIDLVYEDGRTINVPDLCDAAITDNKTVNNVGFANGKAFVALRSGMLIVDAAHGAILESALWGKNIQYIAASDKKIFLYTGSYMYVGDQAGSHHNFDKSFVSFGNFNFSTNNIMRLSGDKIYLTSVREGRLLTVKNDTDNDKTPYYFTPIADHGGVSTANVIVPTRNGAMTVNGTKVNFVSADGTYTSKTISVVNGNKVADWGGDGETLWLADANGFGEYNAATGAFNIARTKPRGTSGSNIGRIIQHPLTGDFYLSTAEVHANSTVTSLAFIKQPYADILNNKTGKITPIVPSNFTTSLYSFNVVPKNPDLVLFGSFGSLARLINVNDNNPIIYDSSNSLIDNKCYINSMQVDSNGNLWMYDPLNNMRIIKVLKGGWESDVNKAKWSEFKLPQLTHSHSNRMILDENKNIAIATGLNGLVAVQLPDSNQPLTASCKSIYTENEIDADGASLGGWKYPALAIDKNGWVWIGNDLGVMYIKDSREMFNPGFAVTRPKVARNDGTSLADYLLNQVEVMCIAVDENNNKWIGTMGSGLYRVNADGSVILEHMTTDNSDIPSNDVLAVCPDRNSNDIYVGTTEGLAIYHSTTSPAAEDYDDVYAYPNPVLPEHTGYITIAGLKANTLIKITDASGNIVNETRSDGGMAVWNGCDASGRRVRSGVYFVFASETGEDASDAAVTKIVVVN